MKVGNLGIKITPRVVLFVATNFSKPGIIKSVGYVFRSVFTISVEGKNSTLILAIFLLFQIKLGEKMQIK